MTLYLLLVMHKDDLYLHVCGKKKVLTTIFGYGNYFLIFRVASCQVHLPGSFVVNSCEV